MRISDYNSLFTMNQLNRTTSAINRSLQRLSTGLRVNSPQDDPAAFSEGVNLDSAVRGYTQAILNINQAIALANTASSAISSQTEIVQKMRELAVQAANGTLSVQDRNNLNTGFQQLVLEFNRITSQTSFNGIQLLDGSFNTTSIQVGTKAGDTISFSTGNTLGSQIFQKTLGSGTFTPSSCGSLNLNFGGTHYLIAPIGFGSPLRDLVVDVNGDGIPDVISRAVTAVGYPSPSVMQVQLGNGDGTFKAPTTYVDGGVFESGNYVAGDLNGDGKIDIVSFTSPGSPAGLAGYVYLGNGDGTFKTPISLGVGSATDGVIVDLDKDGIPDLVYSGNSVRGVMFAKGNGDGTFQAPVALTGDYPMSVAVADFNGDGRLDLATNDRVGTEPVLYLATGPLTYSTNNFVGSYTRVGPALAYDLNNDGKMDLVGWDNNSLTVSLGNGNGTFSAATTYDFGATIQDRKIVDVNGDGIPDLLVATASGIEVRLGNGDGTFGALQTTATGNGISAMGTFDYNKDGFLDVGVIASTDNQFDILTQNTLKVNGVPYLNISTQSKAQSVLTILDNALVNLNGQNSNLGAIQSRLSSAADYSSLISQNLSQAKSSATDVDIASETANLVRQQILQQAGVAALTQANLESRLVLKLLGA